METISFNIHGTCGTWGIFSAARKEDPHCAFEVIRYISRSSIIAAASPPLSVNKDEIGIPVDFLRELIHIDLAKRLEECLFRDHSDYIVIDLGDEWLDLLRVKETLVTASFEFRQSPLYKRFKKHTLPRFELPMDLVRKSISAYSAMIKRLYPRERVILHKVFPADEHLREDGSIEKFSEDILRFNAKFRDTVGYYYDLLEQEIDPLYVVNLSSGYRASEQHTWGLGPFHLEDAYYLEVLKLFKSWNLSRCD